MYSASSKTFLHTVVHTHQHTCPRPLASCSQQVQLVLRLGITDNVTLQTLSDPLHSAADVATFVDALAKEAVPAALPGVAPEDVAVPLGPTTVLLFAPGTESSIYGLSSSGHRRLRSSAPAAAPSASTSSNSTGVVLNAQIGVMLQITLPYTVNTTDAINAYLEVGDSAFFGARGSGQGQ